MSLLPRYVRIIRHRCRVSLPPFGAQPELSRAKCDTGFPSAKRFVPVTSWTDVVRKPPKLPALDEARLIKQGAAEPEVGL